MMLILQRNIYQPVRLRVNGVEVWIMIGRKDNGAQQLLIEAPENVEIIRDELLPHPERAVCQPFADEWLRDRIIESARIGRHR